MQLVYYQKLREDLVIQKNAYVEDIKISREIGDKKGYKRSMKELNAIKDSIHEINLNIGALGNLFEKKGKNEKI